jgi:hypothetical protein
MQVDNLRAPQDPGHQDWRFFTVILADSWFDALRYSRILVFAI